MNSTHNRKYPGRTPATRPIPSDSNRKNFTPTTLFGEKLGLERMKFSLHGTLVAGSEESLRQCYTFEPREVLTPLFLR